MRVIVLCLTLLLTFPAQAKWAFSADGGAAYVMPTGLEGESKVVGPNLTLNLGYQLGDSLRIDLGAMMGKEGSGSNSRLGGFQGLRPAAKLFIFGGSLYGKASIPVRLGGESTLGLLVGGGYELKLFGLLGAFIEGNTGYEGAAGGVVPMEARGGIVFVW